MENSDALELNKFIQKAPGYKEALHYAPLARVTEILAIIGVIDGFVRDRGLSRSEVIIAELMAGSGYLTQFLVKAGYKNIHAFEASNHMSNDDYLRQKNITTHAVEDIYSVKDALKELKPIIIVSLAGFHHMLVYETESVSVGKSIDKQKQVIDICMKCIDRNGLLVIADIRSNDLDNISDFEPECWSTASFKKLMGKQFLSQSCVNDLVRSKDLADYSTKLTNLLMPTLQRDSNPTIAWFHDVVDKMTTVGHKDLPITKALIELLKADYTVRHSKINTPWVFSNLSQLRSYITSFWFLEHKNNADVLDDIYSKCDAINGIRTLDIIEKVTFGWSLSLSTIQHNDQSPPSLFYPNIIVLLVVLIVVSIFGIILKSSVYLSGPIDMISNILVFIIGVTAKEVYDKIKRK